jgi:nucleoside-diphosphate-sugar epimerase
MKIFVTGANGFVGRNVIEYLLEMGHEVTAAVRTAGTAHSGATETVISSIGPESDWSALLIGHDTIIHLAARVHVMSDHAVDPIADFRRVNTSGTATLARAASAQGVRRFVFLSSIKVNGEETQGVSYTAVDVPKPEDPYGISKYEAEVALRTIERESGLDVVIVRTPLVYGPFVGGNFVKLLMLARRRFPLPLASVDNRRTMTSIWNLADLLENAATDANAVGALVLAGDDLSPSTAEVYRAISTAMGKSPRIFPMPQALLAVAGKLTGRSAMVSRLTHSLEVEAGSCSTAWTWHPPLSFHAGIKRTAVWYSNASEHQ